MSSNNKSRRYFLKTIGLGASSAPMLISSLKAQNENSGPFDKAFLIDRSELTLEFENSGAERKLSFQNFQGTPRAWKQACRKKLAELMNVSEPSTGDVEVKELRKTEYQGINIHALIMQVSPLLSIPAYLLVPKSGPEPERGFMAIHGHGRVEPLIGFKDDYHHCFGLEMAKAGYAVLCPGLRGFGTLRNMTFSKNDRWLDYWDRTRGRQFTLVTDGFLYGSTLMGQHVEDLLRWENWFCERKGFKEVDVAGISYGGDLALAYPVFTDRVRKIFAGGTLGSFRAIYARCYNAPAHCIPGILRWMDRSDIAGLNVPRPVVIHYGELDTPGPKNSSASYNETVLPAFKELQAIYRAYDSAEKIKLVVTPGKGHEMDISELKSFFST